MFRYFKNRRRKRLASRPFPPAWQSVIIRRIPFFSQLSTADQQELRSHVRIFLAEKQFEGCNGLQITEDITVTIAAQACLLLLHRDTDYFPRLVTILVYPAAYVAPVVEYSEHGLVTEGEDVLDGEAWQEGVVVLSWKDVRADAANPGKGKNLVLHEFAHQLDMEDNEDNGVPLLPRAGMYTEWKEILSAEYAQLRSDTENGRTTVLYEYGAEDPAEFFAVATECFFMKPGALRIRHPELYRIFTEFYQQDPVQYW